MGQGLLCGLGALAPKRQRASVQAGVLGLLERGQRGIRRDFGLLGTVDRRRLLDPVFFQCAQLAADLGQGVLLAGELGPEGADFGEITCPGNQRFAQACGLGRGGKLGVQFVAGGLDAGQGPLAGGVERGRQLSRLQALLLRCLLP